MWRCMFVINLSRGPLSIILLSPMKVISSESGEKYAQTMHCLQAKTVQTNTQLFCSQDVNWWTGVVWITCGLLWCFYQLSGLSFWRHPFTAEDPLVSKWRNATFLIICSNEETSSSKFWIKAWGWVHFH